MIPSPRADIFVCALGNPCGPLSHALLRFSFTSKSGATRYLRLHFFPRDSFLMTACFCSCLISAPPLHNFLISKHPQINGCPAIMIMHDGQGAEKSRRCCSTLYVLVPQKFCWSMLKGAYRALCVRCVKSWLFSTTGSSVSSED